MIAGSLLATCHRHSSRARYEIRAGVRAAVAGPSGGRLDRRTARQEVEKEGLWRRRRKARGRATS